MRARSLWCLLLGRPRLWIALLAWTIAVLALLVVRHAFFPVEDVALYASEAILILSGLIALVLAALITAHAYLSVRDIRNQLFDGNYEEAYETARRHAGVILGIDFEGPLRRLLDFDRRRAERVAAATRLLGRLMRETPLLLLLGDIEEGQVRFSVALCRLLDVDDNRFALDSLLLQPANKDFAELWRAAASGEKTAAEGEVTLHLPVRQIARRLRLRLLAVQDDEGVISYVLGFASLPESETVPQPETPESILP